MMIVANNMTGPESSGLPEGEDFSGGVCARRRVSCVGPDLELEIKRQAFDREGGQRHGGN